MTEFDRTITDKEEGLKINVARTEGGDDWVHLNIMPHVNLWPRTTVIISLQAAAELAATLLAVTKAEWEE